ncbi:MAG: sensor histidine kinase [Alphaproteobacteria bacterium]|nr:MAG: sensor histidine kinase [Alphaproteobacteria bacterium]
MRAAAASLRIRLTIVILVPTLAIGVVAGLWQLGNARRTADEVFDRRLLVTALAVERDVAVSGGDALSVSTRDLLADTSGGRVFYNVYGPDGVIVAGYASPPVGIPAAAPGSEGVRFFVARYMGREVRGVRLRHRAQIDGLSGVFTTTVWQPEALRAAFAAGLVQRSALVIASLIAALALSIWFGVRIGLRPLTDLEAAIARRSRSDLAPIRRPVPAEVRGIVATLNRLFAELSRKMEAQRIFIANAAHQLRNPIAGALALAEAVERAPTPQALRRRAAELGEAVQEIARLAEGLLALERAEELSPGQLREQFDVAAALRGWVAEARRRAPSGLRIEVEGVEECLLVGDRTLIGEAVRNLIDNALAHGGPGLSRIAVAVAASPAGGCRISVQDDGAGLPAEERRHATERFRSRPGSEGKGLGLSIVEAVMRAHGGSLALEDAAPGLRVTLRFPPAPPPPSPPTPPSPPPPPSPSPGQGGR